VVAVPEVPAAGDPRVSSTGIRRRIAAGDLSGATAQLGALPSLVGEVVRGAGRGRGLGVPTANLGGDLVGVIPADGIYAGWLSVDGQRHPAAISVSDNPTFPGGAHVVEIHVLGVELDLY